MNYDDFIRNRITALRMKEEISEYQLSKNLGHRESYINGITSGRQMPPMKEFIEICRYFKITPQEFFDTETEDPQMVSEAMEGFKQLNEKDQQTILDLINSLKEKEK